MVSMGRILRWNPYRNVKRATAILSARKVADAAFTAALACGGVRVTGIDHRTVVVSSDCAYLQLDILHIRLNGNRFGRMQG